MMKFLAVALVVLVCISVAVVDGRKNKRGKERLQHLEKRREFPRNRMKEGKPNVVEPSNDALLKRRRTPRQVRSLATMQRLKRLRNPHMKINETSKIITRNANSSTTKLSLTWTKWKTSTSVTMATSLICIPMTSE